MYDKIFEVVQDSHRRMVSVSMIFKIEFDDDGFFCFFGCSFFFMFEEIYNLDPYTRFRQCVPVD